jgi:hypothetical protein
VIRVDKVLLESSFFDFVVNGTPVQWTESVSSITSGACHQPHGLRRAIALALTPIFWRCNEPTLPKTKS